MFKVIFTYCNLFGDTKEHSFDYETEENCYNFYSLSEEERINILKDELSCMVDDFGSLISYTIQGPGAMEEKIKFEDLTSHEKLIIGYGVFKRIDDVLKERTEPREVVERLINYYSNTFMLSAKYLENELNDYKQKEED